MQGDPAFGFEGRFTAAVSHALVPGQSACAALSLIDLSHIHVYSWATHNDSFVHSRATHIDSFLQSNAPELHASSDVRERISLHQAVCVQCGTVKLTVWHHLVCFYEVWSVMSEGQFHCLGVSTHSLGQWNWLSDITWCVFMKCDQWCQRASFIVWVWVRIVWDNEIDCMTSLGVFSWCVISDVRQSSSLSLFMCMLVLMHLTWPLTSNFDSQPGPRMISSRRIVWS